MMNASKKTNYGLAGPPLPNGTGRTVYDFVSSDGVDVIFVRVGDVARRSFSRDRHALRVSLKKHAANLPGKLGNRANCRMYAYAFKIPRIRHA